MGKTNFLVEDSWGEMFKELSDENAGQLIKAMFAYRRGESPEFDDPIMNAVLKMVESTMDANDDAYTKTCEKNRENIRKRWALTRAMKENTSEYDRKGDDTTVYERIQPNTNDTDMTCSYHLTEELNNSKNDSEVTEVVEYMNQVLGTKYKPKTKATAEHIRARLREGFTVEDCKRVIDVKFRQWGRDPKMSEYLRPQTLFSGKFESYLNQKTTVDPLEGIT